MHCETRKARKKAGVYPLRYTEHFFAKVDEAAARKSLAAAEDIFETTSS
jgi:hypothetical protein